MFEVYAVATPGLERLAQTELKNLGIEECEATEGGLSLRASFETLCRLNLQSRICSRFIVRLGEDKVTSLKALQHFANGLSWKQFIRTNQPIQVRATCKQSKIYHSGAVIERFQNSLESSIGKGLQYVKGEDVPDDTQRIIVRIFQNQVTVSIDSSGEHLHRRGYRQATAKAPMRENIAASCVLSLGYSGQHAFLDPMTGSGTLAIEAALIAINRAPGLLREFSFMQWPMFRPKKWQALIAQVRAEERECDAPIFSSDRHPGAIDAAVHNATQAGVQNWIHFERATLSERVRELPDAGGFCFINPPYGERMGKQGNLKNLYASINNISTGPLTHWNVGMVTTNQKLVRSACPDFNSMGAPIFHGGKRAYRYICPASEN